LLDLFGAMTGKGRLADFGLNEPGNFSLAIQALAILVLLICYYLPCLSGRADFYVSDITFYYQPFCKFITAELKSGRLPFWNPYLYCGMPQLASPNPALLYAPSWFIFLLPFSAGISVYMIFHQLLLGAGSYLYLRELKTSRSASFFAGAVLSLSAYNFAFIRNITLPASIAWLPLALYFERKIKTRQGERPLLPALGLAFSIAMIVHAGRPEVGVPEILLVLCASVSQPLIALFSRGRQTPLLAATFLKLASLALGFSLGLPALAPGLEWTSLSPRSAGLATRWVFTWSANWYDYLSIVLCQPLGDLCRLNEHTAQFRNMVLSRGGYLPFLSSTYLSPIAVTLAVWGLSNRQNKMLPVILVLLSGFVLMSCGNYTPVAPYVVGLSPLFAAFRYPIKLIIFPCLLIVLLAAHGIDLLSSGRLSVRVLAGTAVLWVAVLIAALVLVSFPQIGVAASHWSWLFAAPPAADIVEDAQHLLAGSMLAAAQLALAACLLAYLCLKNKINPAFAVLLITMLACATLIHSALTYRQVAPAGYYEHQSALARQLHKLQEKQRLPDAPLARTDRPVPGSAACRFLNLYFDPLTVPENYKYTAETSFDENFFQYARELVLYNTMLCFQLPSSYGYEAAETADYKSWFTEALTASSQCHRDKSKKNELVSDIPIHRFARLTASQFVNTQVYGKEGDLPGLNPEYFQLVEENRDLNYRIFRVLNVRPRIYFSRNLAFVDSFKTFEKMLTRKQSDLSAAVFDNHADLSYLLNSDFEKYKSEFSQISSGNPLPGSGSDDGAGTPEKFELLLDNGQEMKLKLSTARPRLLVMADRFYPGWYAELDGKQVEILKANMVNRAVLIPSGQHELRIYYFCRPLAAGTAAALAALFIFLGGYWLIKKRLNA
jgi:hypothetical protein